MKQTTTQDEDEMQDNGAFRTGSESFTYKGIKRAVFGRCLVDSSEALQDYLDRAIDSFCYRRRERYDGTTEGLGTIFLEVHQTTINLDDMIEFFSKLKTREEVKGQGGVLENFGVQLRL
jgi:hypothetical protein